MHSQREMIIQALPNALQQPVRDLMTAPGFDATIAKQSVKALSDASGLDESQLKLALLPLAASFSYTPISKFNVGAIVTGKSGKLYFGANMEFTGAQLGQTVHAEQSAISHAWIKGETAITNITINYSPCGHCRQFMNELDCASEFNIQLPDHAPQPLHYYLPDSFGPKDLNVTEGLMHPTSHGYSLDQQHPLLQRAVDAANMSHAPYTGDHSGIAIELANGKVFIGSYAENAAFNPSLPPLQVALSQVLIHGFQFSDIQSVALVEASGGAISHLADTQATLDVIDPDIPLIYTNI